MLTKQIQTCSIYLAPNMYVSNSPETPFLRNMKKKRWQKTPLTRPTFRPTPRICRNHRQARMPRCWTMWRNHRKSYAMCQNHRESSMKCQKHGGYVGAQSVGPSVGPYGGPSVGRWWPGGTLCVVARRRDLLHCSLAQQLTGAGLYCSLPALWTHSHLAPTATGHTQ